MVFNIKLINDLAVLSSNWEGIISKAAQEQIDLASRQHDLVAQFKL